MTARLAVWLVATALVAQPAAADVLCRTKKGAVFLRGACKKREVAVTLPQGAAGDAGGTPQAPVRVLDSAGKPVGLYADPFNEDNATRVIFDAGARLVSVFVDPAGFSINETFLGGSHVAADCSDPPLFGGPRTKAVDLSTLGLTPPFHLEP